MNKESQDQEKIKRIKEVNKVSQFMICETKNDLVQVGCTKLLECIENKEFLIQVINNVLLNKINFDNLWVFENIDKYFVKTQREIHQGVKFEETDLYYKLNILCDSCDKIILWYGNDFEELDKVINKTDFLFNIRKDIENSICESYIIFTKK